MMKKLICKLFYVVDEDLYVNSQKTIKTLSNKLDNYKEDVKSLKKEYVDCKDEYTKKLGKVNRDKKSNYNRANRHYMRIRRAIDYINNDVKMNNAIKKHMEKLVDILDGQDNDGLETITPDKVKK